MSDFLGYGMFGVFLSPSHDWIGTARRSRLWHIAFFLQFALDVCFFVFLGWHMAHDAHVLISGPRCLLPALDEIQLGAHAPLQFGVGEPGAQPTWH